MRILLRLISPPVVAEFEKGSKPGPGHRQIFSEDFGLEEYDGVAFNITTGHSQVRIQDS
jgi:hypothetical protein